MKEGTSRRPPSTDAGGDAVVELSSKFTWVSRPQMASINVARDTLRPRGQHASTRLQAGAPREAAASVKQLSVLGVECEVVEPGHSRLDAKYGDQCHHRAVVMLLGAIPC